MIRVSPGITFRRRKAMCSRKLCVSAVNCIRMSDSYVYVQYMYVCYAYNIQYALKHCVGGVVEFNGFCTLSSAEKPYDCTCY